MIYTEISQDDFIYSFKSMSEGYKDKFSIDGLRALYDYLNDYSEDTGENIKLDEIATCCEYTEYESWKEFKQQYPNINGLSDLQDRTQYIPVYDFEGRELKRFIVQNF